MKILHVIQRYPPSIGGSEKWCEEICNYTAQKGYTVKVLTTDIYNIEEFHMPPRPDKLHFKFGGIEYSDNILIRRYKISRLSSFWKSLFLKPAFDNTPFGIFVRSPISFEMFRELFKEARESDIVHLHAIPYFHNIVGFCAAKIFGKKVIITSLFHPGHPSYEKKIFYTLMRHCDAVLTMSDYEADYFRKKGINSDRLFTIGCCIHPELYGPENIDPSYQKELYVKHKIKDGSKIVIFIGVKHETKGTKDLISAVSLLIKEGSDVFLFLAGPGIETFDKYYSGLEDSLKKRIIDLGQVSHRQKVSLLHMSDLLVLPSGFESFGIVFLEAWICNKPVIGTEKGAVPSVIGDAGLISKFGDINELKENISYILKNKTAADALALKGRKKVIEKYTWEKTGEKVVKAYNAVSRKYKKRVLIASHLFPPYFLGGSEIVAFEQAKKLKSAGYDVVIFAGKLAPAEPRFKVRAERGIFETTRVNLSYEDFWQIKFANYEKKELQAVFKDALLKYSPDIVHFHNIFPLSLRMIDVCVSLRLPTIMTLHDYWGVCIKNLMTDNLGLICKKNGLRCMDCQQEIRLDEDRTIPLAARNSLFKLSLNKIHRFISPSQYLADAFIACGMPKEKFRVINNGIDMARFERIKKNRSSKVRFVFIGNLLPHKGIENLLIAVSGMKNKEKITLDLIGGGAEAFMKYCRYLVEKLSLKGIVRFRGKVDNRLIHRVYRETDAIILPSVWPENSPVSIMEAMASRTPVLASDVGGIRELVVDGITGLLSDYKDPESIVRNIEKIIKNPDLIKKMGEAGFHRVKKFDLKNQVKMLDEEYRNIPDSNNFSTDGWEIFAYKGDFNNPHTKKLFNCLKKYEEISGTTVDMLPCDLIEEEMLRKAKALIVPHYADGVDYEIRRACFQKMRIFLNKEDGELNKFSALPGVSFYQDADFLETESILCPR